MNLFKNKKWPWYESGILKYQCIIFGLLIGAYFPDFILKNAWIFIILFVLAYIKTIHFYFFTKDD